MIEVFVMIAGGLLGAIFGSFACCQAWRLRLWIEEEKDPGERSVCLHCGHQLKWYENIPIVSWVIQGGKCRSCGEKIGVTDLLAELGGVAMGLVVAWSFVIPLMHEAGALEGWQIAMKVGMILMLVILMTGFIVLAVYDGKWGELPVNLLIACIVCGGIYLALDQLVTILSTQTIDWGSLASAAGSVAILAGVCYLLYKLSDERLMGGGDWLLALSISLVLGNWWLAMWAMMASNMLGSVIMAPAIVVNRRTMIHFGPFLVMAFVIVLAAREFLVSLI